jgi:hypothetical protein
MIIEPCLPSPAKALPPVARSDMPHYQATRDQGLGTYRARLRYVYLTFSLLTWRILTWRCCVDAAVNGFGSWGRYGLRREYGSWGRYGLRREC